MTTGCPLSGDFFENRGGQRRDGAQQRVHTCWDQVEARWKKRHSHADIPPCATAFGTDGSGWAGKHWVQIGLLKLWFKIQILCELFLKPFLFVAQDKKHL